MSSPATPTISWRQLGKSYFVRFCAQFMIVVGVWLVLLLVEELRSAHLSATSDILPLSAEIQRFLADLKPALWAGLLTLGCFALVWTFLTFPLPASFALGICLLGTFVGGMFARFPIPERASSWLLWAGPHTARYVQFALIGLSAIASVALMVARMSRQYERLSSDRIALSPPDEDVVIRSLVQSFLVLVLVLFGGVSLWSIGNIRPVPAVAQADNRDRKPSVLILAVDSNSHAKIIQKRLGDPFFSSWVVFGSPETGAKFDEVLQCRYPIRLIGQTSPRALNSFRDVNDYFVPAAVSRSGYSVSLLHTSARGESSLALKMLSRNFAHVRLFRRFGLLPPARVFYTPDVQLSQMREALTLAANRDKPAFITASLLSREGRDYTQEDVEQFVTLFEVLEQQNWLKHVFVILLEFPSGFQDQKQSDLSVKATSAQVSFWATGALVDSAIIQTPPRLVRGIDLGASIAARLRLSSIVTHCDGAALFDMSERPSVFPRDLVYQETDEGMEQDVLRKRGWLTSDGYRLELREGFEGAEPVVFRYRLRAELGARIWDNIDEQKVEDAAVRQELNRQIDDFLRTAGVEVLNLGNGRTAYSEPFRKIRLLKE